MSIELTPAPLLAGEWTPADNGLLAWSGPLPTLSTAPTNGTQYLLGLMVRSAAASATRKGIVHVATAAVTPTAGQNWMGLFDAAGALQGSAADIGAASSSSGPLVATLGTFALSPGMHWLAIILNAGTPAALGRMSNLTAAAALGNLNLGVAVSRWASNGTGLTSMPSSITPASNSAATTLPTFWGGLS